MFKFKLEPVLSLKEKVEENKKRELGAATMHQEHISSQKKELEIKRLEALRETQINRQSSVDVRSLKIYHTYNIHINKAIELKEKEYKEAQKQVELKRKELLEAVKDRKILDNLKSIQYESFMDEEKKAQQGILDDMVTYKYGRKEAEK